MQTEADSKRSRLIGVALLFGAILFTGLLIYVEVVGGGDVGFSPSPAAPTPIEEQKGDECFDSLKSVFAKICVVPRDSYEELLDK